MFCLIEGLSWKLYKFDENKTNQKWHLLKNQWRKNDRKHYLYKLYLDEIAYTKNDYSLKQILKLYVDYISETAKSWKKTRNFSNLTNIFY